MTSRHEPATLISRSLPRQRDVTAYRSPGCADVLRGARADVTDFSYMTLMDTSVVKHNMLKMFVCTLVGVLIKYLYEMHGVTIRTPGWYLNFIELFMKKSALYEHKYIKCGINILWKIKTYYASLNNSVQSLARINNKE